MAKLKSKSSHRVKVRLKVKEDKFIEKMMLRYSLIEKQIDNIVEKQMYGN